MTDKELIEQGIYRPSSLDDVAKVYLKLGYKILIEWLVPTSKVYRPVFFNVRYDVSKVGDQTFKICLGELFYIKPKWGDPYYEVNGYKVINIYANPSTLFNDTKSVT